MTSSEQGVEETSKAPVVLTPGRSALWGLGFFATGALAAGFSTIVWDATRRRAEEDAIEAAARLKAVPIAARALGISSVVCLALGGMGLAGLYYSDVKTRDVVQVAAMADAMAVGRKAWEITKQEMQRKRSDFTTQQRTEGTEPTGGRSSSTTM